MALQEELTDKPDEIEQASRLFGERVAGLPGVLRVEMHSARITGEQSFTVYIPQGDLGIRNSVYDLESEMYRQFPSARLNVHVREHR
jgi:hypothetical protein